MAGKFSINNMDKVMEAVMATADIKNNELTGKFYDIDGKVVEDSKFEMHEPSLAEISDIVNSVVADCFPIAHRDEDGTGGVEMYAPEFKKFLIKYYIVEKLTNISIPKDISKAYKSVQFVFQFSNIDDVYEGCIGTIETAINERIAHKLQLMAVCREEMIDSLMHQVAQLTGEVEELAGYVSEFADRLDKSLGGESINSAIGKLDKIVQKANIKMNTKD